MKRILLLTLLAASPASARIVDGLAAVVDGRVITLGEVAKAANARAKLGGPAADWRKESLEGLVENCLIQKEAARLGIAVTDDDVQAAAADIRTRNNLTEEAFREALAAQGLPWPDYLEQLKGQILKVKLASQVLRARLRPDDDDLQEFYLKHAADFCQPDQVRLRHLEVPGGRETAEGAKRRLEGGENPEAVARDLAGGKGYTDMGLLEVATLSDTVRGAIRDASAAGVSPVVELGGSCHLFVVSERQTARVPKYDELPPDTKERVKGKYFEEKEDELYRAWIDALKSKARIERFES